MAWPPQRDGAFGHHHLETLVRGERTEVDRRLGVGEAHRQRVPGPELAHALPGPHVGHGTTGAADVELVLHTLIVMLAVILESGERDRLYTALSLLVCTAAEGEQARGLVSFGALPVLASRSFPDEALEQLWETARELVAFEVCAAVGDDGSFPVTSMPRFLKETAGARLVVV